MSVYCVYWKDVMSIKSKRASVWNHHLGINIQNHGIESIPIKHWEHSADKAAKRTLAVNDPDVIHLHKNWLLSCINGHKPVTYLKLLPWRALVAGIFFIPAWVNNELKYLRIQPEDDHHISRRPLSSKKINSWRVFLMPAYVNNE